MYASGVTMRRTTAILRDALHCHVPEGQHDHHDHEDTESHDHTDHRLTGTSGRRLALALVVTAVFFVVQLVGGFWTGSLALLADSAHLLGDAAALLLALGAALLAARPASVQRTFGFRRAEVLAALINGITLVVAAFWIGLEAFERLQEPHPIATGPMLAIALAGLVANAVSLRILGHGHGLNERGAYLHVLGDLLGSVAVVVAGLLIAVFGWYLADPILSLFIGLLVLVSAFRLIKEAVDVLMLAAPRHLDVAAIARRMNEVPGVVAVHDLHLWTVTSGFVSLSAHVLIAPTAESCTVLEDLSRLLKAEFGIEHSTLQVEHESAQAAIHSACAPCAEVVQSG
ncbi:MAG: zinc transporter ZitB [Dehalococcoidia bacterium]|nr:MAG: zinc transporter ZitB [Dehalococcoidia bacterium]